MSAFFRSFLPLPLAGMVLLSACADRPKEVAVAPPPVPVRPVQPPMPPRGATPNMHIPPVGADGLRVTPNRNLSAQAALWHVRMALNVAALSCQGGADAARLQYNQLLKLHKAALAKANAAVDGEYKAKFGSAAIPQRERLNTVVYNFFALPPAQAGFCAEAVGVGATINGLPADQLLAYAPAGLAALEKPFTDFYDAYALYQTQLAAWQGGTAGQSLSLAPAPAASASPVALKVSLGSADLARDDGAIAPKGVPSRLLAKAN